MASCCESQKFCKNSSEAQKARKICENSPEFGNGIRLGEVAFGLPEAETKDSRQDASLARVSSKQTAARGSTDLGVWGPASHDANGIRRPREAGPNRRPLCCEQATDPARSWPRGRERENYEQKEQNSEAKNVVRQTTPSTHPSTPSEFKQMRSGLLHATKPGRRKFKNHLLCQSRFYVTACRIDVFPASLIYTDVERPSSSK